MYERTTANDANVNGAAFGTSYEQANSNIDVHSSSFLGKVYGYMAILILITFLVSFSVGYGLYFGISYYLAEGNTNAAGTLMTIGVTGVVISILAMVVCSIVISFGSIRRQMNIMVPGIIYAVSFGIMLSFMTLVVNEVEPWILPSAFAITAMVFALLFLVTRKATNLTWLGMVGMLLFFGATLLGLVFGIVYILNTLVGLHFMSSASYLLFIILDATIFLAMLFFTAFDVWRITKIAEHGMYSKNLAQYCAFWLYQDFMYLLLRIIRILLLVAARSKK